MKAREEQAEPMLGRLIDQICLFSWIFGYAILIRFFKLLQSTSSAARKPLIRL